MAKPKAPLFSFGARGQLGKAIVYFPWKGVECAREYVIPTNPRTTAQTTQRNRLTAAVLEFHGAAYSADDVGAWTRYASVLEKVMTGFNAMCREFIKEAIVGNVWKRLHHIAVTAVTSTGFKAEISLPDADATPYIHWGTRKTYMPNMASMDVTTPATPSYTFTGLTPNTLYYFYIDVGTRKTNYGRTGIYWQRTLAA